MKATSEQKEQFRKRIDMWINLRKVFGGSWEECLLLAQTRVSGKTRRIRKKRAKVIMATVVRDDLLEFGRYLLRERTMEKSR